MNMSFLRTTPLIVLRLEMTARLGVKRYNVVVLCRIKVMYVESHSNAKSVRLQRVAGIFFFLK